VCSGIYFLFEQTKCLRSITIPHRSTTATAIITLHSITTTLPSIIINLPSTSTLTAAAAAALFAPARSCKIYW
jgi:hypothetical protein